MKKIKNSLTIRILNLVISIIFLCPHLVYSSDTYHLSALRPPLVCVDLGNKFYVYDYVYSDELQYVCPAITDDMLKNKLEDLDLRTYRALECKDFGRVDIRVDEQNNPYVLEINPLPSLSKADAYGVVGKYWGVDYSEMIKRILNAVLERYGIR